MDTNSIGMGEGSLEILRSLFSLILILGMMVAAYFWLKRRRSAPGAGGKRMRVLERLPVDTRRSILLLEVDGEEIMVGIGTDSITPIKTLETKGGSNA